MRHYEIVLIIHPKENDNIEKILKNYKDFIITHNGKIHRMENWSKRQLTYPIKNVNRAFYILMNVQTKKELIENLSSEFKLNDSVIRYVIIRVENAITQLSPIEKIKDKNFEQKNSNKREINSFN